MARSASRAAMMRLEKQGNRDATIVNRLLATRERMLGAILFANNLTNIGASTLATGLLLTLFGQAGVIYATLVMTVAIFVIAEVLPKTAAFNMPDRIALVVARPVEGLVRWFSPILRAVEWLVRIILHGFGMPVGKIHSILTPREELRGAVDLLHRAGVVEKLDRDMMGGVLDLRELSVSDVMVHRTKMIMLDADEPPQAIVDAVLAAAVSRLPLWRGSTDNILGVLHAKDLLRALHAAGGDATKIDIVALATPPWFVPDTTPLSEQLKAFRDRKTAVRAGGRRIWRARRAGDARRHRRGDRRRHQRRARRSRSPACARCRTARSMSTARCRCAISTGRWTGTSPTTKRPRSPAWSSTKARSIPEPGQSFTFHGFRFQVLRKNRNRITALRVDAARPQAGGGGEGGLSF